MTLSLKDQEILDRIFNPSLFIPTEDTEDSNVNEKDEEVSGNLKVKELEIDAIKVAESTDPPTSSSLLCALNLIEEAIEIDRITEGTISSLQAASLLNNKAQILRLLGRDSEALECLDLVLSSSATRKVVRQSSAQRAWLHFRLGYNEAAFKDFECAAKLGCLESKRMAVRCNPYAAMCNQMLQEIIGSTFYSK